MCLRGEIFFGKLDPAGFDEDGPKEEPVTASWALLHALTHLQEHTAQLQITRQFFLANVSG